MRILTKLFVSFLVVACATTFGIAQNQSKDSRRDHEVVFSKGETVEEGLLQFTRECDPGEVEAYKNATEGFTVFAERVYTTCIRKSAPATQSDFRVMENRLSNTVQGLTDAQNNEKASVDNLAKSANALAASTSELVAKFGKSSDEFTKSVSEDFQRFQNKVTFTVWIATAAELAVVLVVMVIFMAIFLWIRARRKKSADDRSQKIIEDAVSAGFKRALSQDEPGIAAEPYVSKGNGKTNGYGQVPIVPPTPISTSSNNEDLARQAIEVVAEARRIIAAEKNAQANSAVPAA